jgi:hypothetical protein
LKRNEKIIHERDLTQRYKEFREGGKDTDGSGLFEQKMKIQDVHFALFVAKESAEFLCALCALCAVVWEEFPIDSFAFIPCAGCGFGDDASRGGPTDRSGRRPELLGEARPTTVR